MNKAEMKKIIDRYAVVNAEKSAAAKEVDGLGKEIKAYFTERGLCMFETDNNLACVSYRNTKTLDTAKLAAHFGGVIPAKFYTEKQSPVLTVKPCHAVSVAVNVGKVA